MRLICGLFTIVDLSKGRKSFIGTTPILKVTSGLQFTINHDKYSLQLNLHVTLAVQICELYAIKVAEKLSD
jgi:hypothetical protein